MTSVADAGSRPRRGTGERGDLSPTWPRVAVVVAVLLLAFFVARSCQQSQIRITKEQAIATAEREVDFTPQDTQIRLLRQGLDSKPFWIVSLSIPKGDSEDRFSRLALVHVDANTGRVTKVEEQAPAQTKGP